MSLAAKLKGAVSGLMPARKRAAAAAPARSTFSITVGDDDTQRMPLAQLDIIKVPASQAVRAPQPASVKSPAPPSTPPQAQQAAAAPVRAAAKSSAGSTAEAPEPPVLTERLPVRERRQNPRDEAPAIEPGRSTSLPAMVGQGAAAGALAVPVYGAPPKPPLSLRQPVAVGLAVLLLGGTGFVGWAATAPLAEGVPADGYVKLELGRKSVQHLRGGIVQAIQVHEGDTVKAGQVLFTLNDTDVRARLQMVESRLMGALAFEARLLAERRGAAQLVFPAELTAHAGENAADEAMRTQQQLFDARRSGVRTDVAMQESNTVSLEAYLRGLQADADSKAEQVKLMTQELRSQRDLAAQGYVPRNRVSELDRQLLLLQGQLSEAQGNISRVRGSISESRMKVSQRRNDVSKDVETQLTEVQSRVNDLREQMNSLRDEYERMVIRAPGDGIVVDLQVHSVGAVINASQRLLDVVPAREPLLVEAQVPARLFDNLRSGMPCDVRFTGPDQSVTKPVKGTVVYVAPDRSIDPTRGDSYFVTRVQVTDQALADANLKVMQPGMPATVMITTAQRSLLHYLISPLTKRLPGALAER